MDGLRNLGVISSLLGSCGSDETTTIICGWSSRSYSWDQVGSIDASGESKFKELLGTCSHESKINGKNEYRFMPVIPKGLAIL